MLLCAWRDENLWCISLHWLTCRELNHVNSSNFHIWQLKWKTHKGLKAWNLTSKSRESKKSWNLISKLCSKSNNSHKQISYENYAPKSMTSHKKISLGISPGVPIHIRCYNRPWDNTQSPACFNTISLPSLHHIITNNQPQPPTETSSHNSTSLRHVKSFSNIRIDSLIFMPEKQAVKSPPRHQPEPPTEPSNHWSMSLRHVQPVVLKNTYRPTSNPHPPFSRTSLSNACLRITPRHQSQLRLCWNNRVWEKGKKAWHLVRKSHNVQKAWKIIRISHHLSRTTYGHGITLNLPHASAPPLYHHYITSSPPTPDLTLQSQ